MELELRPHPVQVELAVPDGDDEVVADEDEHLAEADVVDGLVPARRLEHEQEHVAVALELGPLVRLDRIFDGERVQAELAGDGVELVVGRLVQADPHEPADLVAPLVELVERRLIRNAVAVLVDGVVDDHAVERTALTAAETGLPAKLRRPRPA